MEGTTDTQHLYYLSVSNSILSPQHFHTCNKSQKKNCAKQLKVHWLRYAQEIALWIMRQHAT